MKFLIFLILVLVIAAIKQWQDIRELNARVDELTIIVNQKYLPPLILETLNIR